MTRPRDTSATSPVAPPEAAWQQLVDAVLRVAIAHYIREAGAQAGLAELQRLRLVAE